MEGFLLSFFLSRERTLVVFCRIIKKKALFFFLLFPFTEEGFLSFLQNDDFCFSPPIVLCLPAYFSSLSRVCKTKKSFSFLSSVCKKKKSNYHNYVLLFAKNKTKKNLCAFFFYFLFSLFFRSMRQHENNTQHDTGFSYIDVCDYTLCVCSYKKKVFSSGW